MGETHRGGVGGSGEMPCILPTGLPYAAHAVQASRIIAESIVAVFFVLH